VTGPLVAGRFPAESGRSGRLSADIGRSSGPRLPTRGAITNFDNRGVSDLRRA